MSNFGAMKRYIDGQNNRPLIEKLIEDKPYSRMLSELKQLAEDKGYTAEWLKKQTAELNKEYYALCEKAVIENRQTLDKAMAEYKQANDIYFEHNYSAADHADIQFLQNLIRTRLVNECQNQPVLAERVIAEYINTQKGARAIMFLANDPEISRDSQISEVLKSHYTTATQNAQSAAEKRFYADKEAALNKMMSEINPLTFNDVLGTAMLSEASEWVGMDKAEKVGNIYFPEPKQPRLPSMEEVNPWYESLSAQG
ncbi:MAG: hypothetical protein ACOX4U_02840 [Anaerovoracaceae bacterium]|jgi:hypothetical protein